MSEIKKPGPEAVKKESHSSKEQDELKKIREVIRLFLALKNNKDSSKVQLAQVERKLGELMGDRTTRMIANIEEAYNMLALQKDWPLLDLKDPSDREVLKVKWGIDVEKFPYVVDFTSKEGLGALQEYFES